MVLDSASKAKQQEAQKKMNQQIPPSQESEYKQTVAQNKARQTVNQKLLKMDSMNEQIKDNKLYQEQKQKDKPQDNPVQDNKQPEGPTNYKQIVQQKKQHVTLPILSIQQYFEPQLKEDRLRVTQIAFQVLKRRHPTVFDVSIKDLKNFFDEYKAQLEARGAIVNPKLRLSSVYPKEGLKEGQKPPIGLTYSYPRKKIQHLCYQRYGYLQGSRQRNRITLESSKYGIPQISIGRTFVYDKWQQQDYIAIKNINLFSFGVPYIRVLDFPIQHGFRLSTSNKPIEGQIRGNVKETNRKFSYRLERLTELTNRQSTVGIFLNSFFDQPVNSFYLKLSREDRVNKLNKAHSSPNTVWLADLLKMGSSDPGTMYSCKLGYEFNKFFKHNLLGQDLKNEPGNINYLTRVPSHYMNSFSGHVSSQICMSGSSQRSSPAIFGSTRFLKTKIFLRGINTFILDNERAHKFQVQSNIYLGHLANVSDPTNQYQGLLPMNDNFRLMNIKGHKNMGYVYNRAYPKSEFQPIGGENLGFAKGYLSSQIKLLLLPPDANSSLANYLQRQNIVPFIFANGCIARSGSVLHDQSDRGGDQGLVNWFKNSSRTTVGLGLSMQFSWTAIEAYFNLKGKKQKNESWLGFQLNFGID